MGVLGAGAWGSTISLLLSKKNNVLIWANEKKVVREINLKNKNDTFLQGVKLNKNIKATSNFNDFREIEFLLLWYPHNIFRKLLKN